MARAEAAPPSTPASRRRGSGFWWCASFGGCALLCLWWYALPPAPEFIETYYYRPLYRPFAGWMAAGAALFPFSLALVGIVVLVLAFLFLWAVAWRARRRAAQSHWRGFAWGLQWGALAALVLATLFIPFCGAQYRRPPIEARLGLDTEKPAPEEMREILASLLHILEETAAAEDRDPKAAIAALSASMERVVGQWERQPRRLPRRAKSTPRGLLLITGTAGIFFPFTTEAHVDGALPAAAFVFVAAHELGHVAGFMNEAEAELVGYVSGLHCGHAFARYAAALNLYTDIALNLRGKARQQAIDALPEIAKEDMAAYFAAGERYLIRWEWAQRAGYKIYDTYLKSQGIKEGMINYSRSVNYFVWAWRKGLVELPRAG